MKKLEWIHGNKARIETGHKTFDRYCTCISTGNVIGDGQYSSFIRPRSETECNGFTFPAGACQDFDLQHFKGLPKSLRDFIAQQEKSVILYEFFHEKRGKRVSHGYIITQGNYPNYKLVKMCVTGPTHKSFQVLNWVKDYICDSSELVTQCA